MASSCWKLLTTAQELHRQISTFWQNLILRANSPRLLILIICWPLDSAERLWTRWLHWGNIRLVYYLISILVILQSLHITRMSRLQHVWNSTIRVKLLKELHVHARSELQLFWAISSSLSQFDASNSKPMPEINTKSCWMVCRHLHFHVPMFDFVSRILWEREFWMSWLNLQFH